MAKEAMRFILTISLMFLAGCATMQTEPSADLVKVEVQKLVNTAECSGKGVRVYSVKSSNKRFRVKENVFYLSPGKWDIAYIPEMEDLENGVCEELEGIVIHGEFIIKQDFELNKSYFIFLNDSFRASISENAI
jgi:outer membrane lipoprotein-sorting protein